MRKPQLGLWTDFAAKIISKGNSKVGPQLAKKRRHQKQPRICPIQLEPLEQRQLLSTNVTPDLFAVTSGTQVNSTSTPWWTTVNGNGTADMAVQQVGDDQLQTILSSSLNTSANTYYLNIVGATTTANSVQQVSVSSGGQWAKFGLVARATTNAGNYYIAEIDDIDDQSDAGVINQPYLKIIKVVGATSTTLGSYALPAGQLTDQLLPTNTFYNIKFSVQTDAANSLQTDLSAEVWQQGTTDPGWQVSANDSSSPLAAGYNGLWDGANHGTQGPGLTSTFSNYQTTTSGDMPAISSFTASPTNLTSTGTVTFNASAISPASYGSGVSNLPEAITKFVLSFGDPGSTPVTVSSSSFATVTHSYTSTPSLYLHRHANRHRHQRQHHVGIAGG